MKKAFNNIRSTKIVMLNLFQHLRFKRFRNKFGMTFRRAFTLAEVLITLTIIGVIAAITIPNLMQKWQNEAIVTKVKKGYNAITRMASNIKIQSGCNDLECTGLLDITDTQQLHQKFAELAGLKKAKINYYRSGPRAMYMYCEKQSCNNTKGEPFYDLIVTQDGMAYSVIKAQRATTAPVAKFINIKLFTESNPKKGYKLGRNVFEFLITSDFRAEPLVMNSSATFWTLSEASQKVNATKIDLSNVNKYCTPNDTTINSGRTCAAKIVLDGWKMKY